MILVRSPLRVTFGGGGTDLPSYYRRFGGYLISAAINKYVYISVVNPFTPGVYLKTNVVEEAPDAASIGHPLIRECLKELKINRVALTSFADIPASSGLGSSGSFVTAILKALHVYARRPISTDDLARLACDIEIGRAGLVGGKQDQYIAAYGGINAFTFNTDDSVKVAPLALSNVTLRALEDNLLLFFTGFTHNSSEVQASQNAATNDMDLAMLTNLEHVKILGHHAKTLLEDGNMRAFAGLMHEQWLAKRQRNPQTSSSAIDRWYDRGIEAGALGGKLVGAGGGGFLMFYTEDPPRLRSALSDLEEVRFGFDFEGTRVMVA